MSLANTCLQPTSGDHERPKLTGEPDAFPSFLPLLGGTSANWDRRHPRHLPRALSDLSFTLTFQQTLFWLLKSTRTNRRRLHQQRTSVAETVATHRGFIHNGRRRNADSKQSPAFTAHLQLKSRQQHFTELDPSAIHRGYDYENAYERNLKEESISCKRPGISILGATTQKNLLLKRPICLDVRLYAK